MVRWIRWPAAVHYVFGLARNARLQGLLAPEFENVRSAHAAACELARREGREEPHASRGFAEFQYRTQKSWSRSRRVIGKAEITGDKDNPRFIVTDLTGQEPWIEDLPALASGRALYENFYCARGDMENRIKEQQLDLFADRTSTAPFAANQLRLWFSTFVYLLVARLRATALQGTVLARDGRHHPAAVPESRRDGHSERAPGAHPTGRSLPVERSLPPRAPAVGHLTSLQATA